MFTFVPKKVPPTVEAHGKEILVMVVGANFDLPLKDVLALNVVCKHTHVMLLPVIENNYVFRNPKQIKHSTASPRFVRIRVRDFFQSIKFIPPSTTHITFSNSFNLSLDKYLLPPSLSHLTFGYFFNSSLSKFPLSLTHLTFGHNFNKLLIYPPTITHLIFGNMFQQRVDNLPSSLVSLNFGPNYTRLDKKKKNRENGEKREKGAEEYRCHSYGGFFIQPVDHLPPSLTHLTLCGSFNRPIDNLPRSLTYLVLGFTFNQPVDRLPPSLLYLELGYLFRDHLIDSLPASLTHLIVNEAYHLPVISLPPSLTHLTLLAVSEIPNLETTLPATLQQFSFPRYLNHKYKLFQDKFPATSFNAMFHPEPPPLPFSRHSYRYHRRHCR